VGQLNFWRVSQNRPETECEQPDRISKNPRKEPYHESQDEHQGRQCNVGQLNFDGFPETVQKLNANSLTESAKIQERSPTMKVKTNTKAGNVLWGS
jgi:hypothetical protein